MGESQGKAREYRINRYVLAAAAALAAVILLALIYIVPRYGNVLAEYRVQKNAYNTADSELRKAEKANKELTERVTKLEELQAESDAVRAEVFTMAAKTEQDILNGHSDRKICYITIDDGPYNRGNKYLELFNKYDIKATFFLTTANGNKLPDQGDITAESMYPEYLRYGHTIGNHTYSHNYNTGGIYSSAKSFMDSVEKQQEFTKNATGGYTPEIVRFPGGTSTAGSKLESIQNALREKGYGWVDWTIDSGDSSGGKNASVKAIKKTVINASKKQKIMVVLFHEWSQNSIDAMPDIIETLTDEGFIFLPLFKDSAMVSK